MVVIARTATGVPFFELEKCRGQQQKDPQAVLT